MNRFKETEIGSYLNDNFPEIFKMISNSTEKGCLPDPKFIRSVWESTPNIKIESKVEFEELIMFYQVPCETKISIELEIAKTKMEIRSIKIGRIVLCLLASIGLIQFIFYLCK